MNGDIAKLTPFDASKRALEGTTNFRENANYSWGWLAQHASEVNKLIDDLNIYKNGLKDILADYVLETLDENVVNNAISKKINISDVQDVLNSTATDKPLSANQGRILKEFIENITLILSSDDTDLDELQEIINFMKQSKSALDTLITGIEANYYTKEQINNLNIVPVSTVLPFATTNIPDGFLECNGAAISRTAYSKLFAAIGATFGSGDGSTTFNIPDLRGEFIRGWDNGRGLDIGRTLGSKQTDELKSHAHTGTAVNDGAHSHVVAHGAAGSYDYGVNIPNSEGFNDTGRNSYVNTNTAGAHTHSLTINNTGGIETRPRNIALMYCIKY